APALGPAPRAVPDDYTTPRTACGPPIHPLGEACHRKADAWSLRGSHAPEGTRDRRRRGAVVARHESIYSCTNPRWRSALRQERHRPERTSAPAPDLHRQANEDGALRGQRPEVRQVLEDRRVGVGERAM